MDLERVKIDLLRACSDNVTYFFLTIDGEDACIRTLSLAPDWIANATESDLRRVAVY